jgi:hypothetical protein
MSHSYLVGSLVAGGVCSALWIAGCGGASGGGAGSTPDASTTMEAGKDSSMDVDAAADAYQAPEVSVEAAAEAGPEAGSADGGPPGVSTTTLDFGLVNCGSTANAQTFTIDNPSFASVAWTATLGHGAASPFTLSPATGTLASGGSVQVTVTPNAVPTSASTSANALGDVVTVSLNSSSATVTLSETAQGAVLLFVPATLPFGPVPLSAGPDTEFFGVQNEGNVDADVTLTLTGDPSFTLPSSATTQALTVMDGSSDDSSITFTPTTTNNVTASVAMTTAPGLVLCSPLPTPLAVSGNGTNGQVAVSPAQIVFGTNGLVPCGTNAQPQTVTLQNTGTASFTWSGVLTHGSTYYTISPASGTVTASSSVPVTVTPKPIPATSTTTPGEYDDTLTITTNISGDSPHLVGLEETAQGAIVVRSTNSVSFGNVGVGGTSAQQITFANTGNVSATLVFANGSSSFVQTSPLTVGAGTFASESVSFSPTALQTYGDIGTVALDTETADGGVAPVVPLCGALPGDLTLSGTGTNPTVTAAPSTLNFGDVPCGQTGTALPTTITNNGPATTYTVTLLKGTSSYFSVAPASGSLTAGGTAQLTVTPAMIPQYPNTTSSAPFSDTLQLVTGGGTIVDVTLNMTPLGAILAVSKPTAFGPITHGTTTSQTVTVTNSGTGGATVTLTTSWTTLGDAGSPDGGTDPWTVAPASSSVTASGSAPYTVTFGPPAAGTYGGTLTVSAPTASLCAELPAPIAISGTAN